MYISNIYPFRFLRGEIDDILSDVQLSKYIILLKRSIWPNGKLRETQPPPSEEYKAKIAAEARQALINLVPSEFRFTFLILFFVDFIIF